VLTDGVENRVDESDVAVGDENRRFGTQSNCSINVLLDDESDALVSVLAEFRRSLDLIVASQFAQTLSSTKKDGVFESFGEEEEQNDENDTSDPEELVESPSPSVGLSCETALA